MKSAEPKTTTASIQREAAGSFFGKSEEAFFKPSPVSAAAPFFSNRSATPAVKSTSSPLVQAKCTSCENEVDLIQRDEKTDATETKGPEQNPAEPSNPNPKGLSPRFSKCSTDPQFPDFKCLTYALKLDIDENLWNNAARFYQVASLHPGDNKLMLDTFLRYGVGVNLLQTGFGFAGANKKTANILSYGTGIALKSYDFLQNGVIKLDVPIPLGKGLNLDLKFDLTADPNNLRDVKGVDTQVGISGHF